MPLKGHKTNKYFVKVFSMGDPKSSLNFYTHYVLIADEACSSVHLLSCRIIFKDKMNKQ